MYIRHSLHFREVIFEGAHVNGHTMYIRRSLHFRAVISEGVHVNGHTMYILRSLHFRAVITKLKQYMYDNVIHYFIHFFYHAEEFVTNFLNSKPTSQMMEPALGMFVII